MAGNLVLVALLAVTPTLVFWLLFRLLGLADRSERWVHRRRRDAAPTGPPIERLAADLRRVHCTIAECPPGTPIVRRRAACLAYDTLLVQACAALEVPQQLDVLHEGFERDVERLRVEEALRAAGLMVP